MIYRHGPDTDKSRTFIGSEEVAASHEQETGPLEVKLELPSADLFVQSHEGEGIVTPGWRAERADFNPETGRQETIVVKGDQRRVVDTEELDNLQLEMYRVRNEKLGSGALHHVDVVEPEPGEQPVKVHIIHDAQKET